MQDSHQGWAVASWLVANASQYGITFVRYQGYQWLGFRGTGTLDRGTGQDARAGCPVRGGVRLIACDPQRVGCVGPIPPGTRYWW